MIMILTCNLKSNNATVGRCRHSILEHNRINTGTHVLIWTGYDYWDPILTDVRNDNYGKSTIKSLQ